MTKLTWYLTQVQAGSHAQLKSVLSATVAVLTILTRARHLESLMRIQIHFTMALQLYLANI